MENGILVELKYVELANEGGDSTDTLIRKRNNQKWSPNNIAEYFFFDDYGFLSISEKKIKDIYREYTQTMSDIYAKIKKDYNTFAKKVLSRDDIQNRSLDIPFEICTELEMKGLEFFLDKEKT